nr:reverse transcriptase domain-containing protein [Tanacetum cinerariifolium]
MPSHFHKKFCWGTVFTTGRRSFIEPKSGLRKIRKNHKTRVLIDLYLCHIKEKITMKEVKGESVIEWRTKVTTKDGIVIKFPGQFGGYKLANEEEVEENEELKKVWEQIVTQLTTNVNNANGECGNGRNNGCSYKNFTSCNPKEFYGKGGAISLTRWIEKMESVFDNSGCTAGLRVRYAARANHVAYTDRFHELAKLVPHLVTPESSHIKRGHAMNVGVLTICAMIAPNGNKLLDKQEDPLALEGSRSTQSNGKQARGGAFNGNAVDALHDPRVVTEIADGKSVKVDKCRKHKMMIRWPRELKHGDSHLVRESRKRKENIIDEIKITMASAIICLATNQKFNFSRYILLSFVKNIEAGVPFYMFPRFVKLLVDHQLRDMSYHQDIYDNPSLTKKVKLKMMYPFLLKPSTFKPHKKQKSKKQQPIAPKVPYPKPSPEHQLPSPSNDPIPDANKDSLKLQELVDLCTRFSNKVLDLESKFIDIKSSFTAKIEKLEDRVQKLKEENMILKEMSFKSAKIDTTSPVKDKEESFKQGRMIADIDEDVEVNLQEAQAKAYNLDLQHSKKVLSMQDIDEEKPAEVKEVLEVVTAAKLMTEVVAIATPTTTVAQVPNVKPKDNGKGILIEEPKPLKHQEQIEQDEAFGRQLEAKLNANINWNDIIEQVKRSERQNIEVMRYQALKRKPLTEAQERKNMMIYLKNMASFKMNFFKGMTYSEIRPLFENHYNSIQAFLEKEEKEVIVQEKEIEEEGNKRQEELKRHFQIVANDDDDVFTEATPLASKFPNFDIEDLEALWKLVKERFETTELKNFSVDFLLNILKIMFEKPDIKANVWKDQNGRYGLAKVKS